MDSRSQPSRVGPVVSAVGHLATLCKDEETKKVFPSHLGGREMCAVRVVVYNTTNTLLANALRVKSVVDALGRMHQPQTGDPVPPALFRNH